ncbi:MAG: polymer-forming cytoskeletal protein [Spirochaetaceae bacterium]
MANLRVKNIDEADIDTVLAEDIEFEGELVFHDPLLIKGSFTGEIRASGDLFVSETANVDAKIEARTVSVKGHVNGDVHAHTRLELFETARVSGSIRTPDLFVQSGSLINGTCRMGPQEAEAGAGSGAEAGKTGGESGDGDRHV